MAKREIKKGATSKILLLFIRDSSQAGEIVGLTGLAYNTSGLTCYYHRNSAGAAVSVTLANMTLGDYTSGGFKEVDATNMPGIYQLGLPDAALATGAESVAVVLQGAANMEVLPLEIELTATDNQNSLVAGIQGVKQTLDALNDASVASIVAGVWNEPQTSYTTAGTFGAFLDATISSFGATVSTQLGTGAYAIDLLSARDNIAKQLADITANPKPTYDIDGQRVDWDAHFRALSAQLESIELAIQGSEPFEVRTTGYTQ
ncbi:MAG: hypothetical protein KDA42_07045 [Planctomycetales bacterium]|nr:hypothetical protein [Planctomycetales bacterium]